MAVVDYSCWDDVGGATGTIVWGKMGFSELLREVQEMAQSLRMVAPPIKGEFGDAFLSFVLGKILETFLDCQKKLLVST